MPSERRNGVGFRIWLDSWAFHAAARRSVRITPDSFQNNPDSAAGAQNPQQGVAPRFRHRRAELVRVEIATSARSTGSRSQAMRHASVSARVRVVPVSAITLPRKALETRSAQSAVILSKNASDRESPLLFRNMNERNAPFSSPVLF